MRTFIVSLAVGSFAVLTTYALLQITPDRSDVAVPVIISGLWIAGVLGLIGLTLWSIRDIRARREAGDDTAQ